MASASHVSEPNPRPNFRSRLLRIASSPLLSAKTSSTSFLHPFTTTNFAVDPIRTPSQKGFPHQSPEKLNLVEESGSTRSGSDNQRDGANRVWSRLMSAISAKSRISSIFRKKSRTKQACALGGIPEKIPDQEPNVITEKRADDWFYHVELNEMREVAAKRHALRQALDEKAHRECTFHPEVKLPRRVRVQSGFLRRQRLWEERRAQWRGLANDRKQWVDQDQARSPRRRPVDPEAVWGRSVEWDGQRLEKRINREIDRRVDDLAGQYGGGGGRSRSAISTTRKTTREQGLGEFQKWKGATARNSRDQLYRSINESLLCLCENDMGSV